MNNSIFRYNLRRPTAFLAGFLLLTASLASLGAGPDGPSASNVDNNWEVFKGHAYAENRAAPSGVSLVACLGGCQDGYQTDAVITGKDGIYQVKVEPGQFRPAGRMVTFWLLNGSERVEADQDVLFRGQGETRVLDLNFVDLPSAVANGSSRAGSESGVTTGSATDSGSTTRVGSTATGGSTAATDSETASNTSQGGVTTDLTVPSANELGLVPSGSPQAYVNTVSYGGMPLLPGFVMVLGLLLAMIGVSLLIYRRRLTWR